VKKLRVLVVDDDFMIARMHGKFIEQQEGYLVAGIAHNCEQALSLARELQPDLVLLDVYLPDRSGIEALRALRGERVPCDVVLITAAREVGIIEDAFRLGIFDYLIKPFDLDLLKDALVQYRQFKSHLRQAVQPDQRFVAGLRQLRAAQPAGAGQTQKGIDARTLELVRHSLAQDGAFRTAEQVALAAGVSRSTARAYLDYLFEKGQIEELLHYGTVGRPQRQFRLKGGG